MQPEVTGPAWPAATDDVVESLARELVTLYRGTTLDLALEIGRRVVDRLYGGDLAIWRERGHKDTSFRALAARAEALGARGLSASTLQQSVAILDLELRVGVSGRPQLSVSHVRAVLGLPPDRQESLLGAAEARDWTAERLTREAAKAKAKLTTRTGRPPTPAFVRTVSRWERDVQRAEVAFDGIDAAAALSDANKDKVRAAVAAIQARCAAVLAALDG